MNKKIRVGFRALGSAFPLKIRMTSPLTFPPEATLQSFPAVTDRVRKRQKKGSLSTVTSNNKIKLDESLKVIVARTIAILVHCRIIAQKELARIFFICSSTGFNFTSVHFYSKPCPVERALKPLMRATSLQSIMQK